MTDQPQADLLERFKPNSGRLLGACGLVLVLLAGSAVASTGLDRTSRALLAALALVAVLVWAALVRPALHAYADHLLVRNSWSDLRIPWGEITDVDVKQTLRVYVGTQRHHCVAVGKSARQMIRGGQRRGGLGGAMLGAQRFEEVAERPTLTGAHTTGMHYADYVAIKIQTYAASQRGHPGPVVETARSWAWPEIVAAVAMVVALGVALVVG